MATIDLTKLTKDEIERDFVTRCGHHFEVLKIGIKNNKYPIVLLITREDGTETSHEISSEGRVWAKEIGGPDTNYDLIPRPVETFEKDEKVMVRQYIDDEWKPRHYAKFKDGGHYCYMNNVSSWTTATGHLTRWEFIRKPTPEELAK